MQTQSQNFQPNNSPSPTSLQQSTNNHIQLDMQLIKNKQKLLTAYYLLNNDHERIELIKKWPNQDILQQISKVQTIIKTNNGWYFGKICNEMFHGYGILIYEQMHANNNNTNNNNNDRNQYMGRFYQGQFQNNCKHGYGLQYISGDLYIGKFINNKPQDKNGIFIWKNNDLYMGSFINGMKHGQGRWESGQDYYQGSWKLNRPQGLGKIHTSISDYQGDIKNGYKHGHGIELFANGDHYEGLYANGKPEGDGIYSWKNGAVYKGQFKNGIRYGYGVWVYGTQSYEGDYINDKRNGQGVYKWGNGSYYKGDFLDDLRHGNGQMHWDQNSYYIGQWREGVQSGQGQIWEQGNLVNKGIFEQGKLIKQPNRLQKSNATESNKSNPTKNNNKLHHTHNLNTPIKTNILIQKQRQKLSATRYPAIQKKDQSHSNSNHNKLSQIDQFPPVAHKKKYIASTSFSNQTKHSVKSSLTHQSFDTKRDSYQGEGIKTRNFFYKKQNHEQQKTPIKQINYSTSKSKKIHVSSRKAIYQKKKLYATANKTSKQINLSDLNQTHLGPIKWKNFTHIKVANSDINHHIPQI